MEVCFGGGGLFWFGFLWLGGREGRRRGRGCTGEVWLGSRVVRSPRRTAAPTPIAKRSVVVVWIYVPPFVPTELLLSLWISTTRLTRIVIISISILYPSSIRIHCISAPISVPAIRVSVSIITIINSISIPVPSPGVPRHQARACERCRGSGTEPVESSDEGLQFRS